MNENFECAKSIWPLKKDAWKLGQESASNSDLIQRNLQTLNDAIAAFSGGQPNPNLKRAVYKSYLKGLTDHSVQKDKPECAMSAIRWYAHYVSPEFRKREHAYRLTRSKNYILLAYFAYALGHRGNQFTFAEHRIQKVLTENGYNISAGTISGFYIWARKNNFLVVEKEGDNRPGCHAPTLYRLANIEDLVDVFGMDQKSKVPEARGRSFVDYVECNL